MAVLRPVKLVIENYPDGQVEEVEVVNNPEDPSTGMRRVPFSREVWIERDDFREEPPKGYFRLFPGNEVRLRAAYLVRCTGCVKDQAGEVVEVRGVYDPESRGGSAPDGRRVKGTIHWVSVRHAVEGEVRLYDYLFASPDPEGEECGGDFRACLNAASLETVRGCKLEPGLAGVEPGYRCQFERLGYFCADRDSRPGALVFNRTLSLRDTWAKVEKKLG
jgi:glutaminyl-tRNA synthetase